MFNEFVNYINLLISDIKLNIKHLIDNLKKIIKSPVKICTFFLFLIIEFIYFTYLITLSFILTIIFLLYFLYSFIFFKNFNIIIKGVNNFLSKNIYLEFFNHFFIKSPIFYGFSTAYNLTKFFF